MNSMQTELIHALQMAIQNEKDNSQIYHHILRQMKDPGARELLVRLIEEERQHREKIEQKILEMGGKIVPPESNMGLPNREQLMEMELENCSISELIDLAIENERISRDFYQEQHSRVNDQGVKAVFQWLIEQENNHIEMLIEKHRNWESVNRRSTD